MLKKIIVLSLFLTNTVWAFGPEIECRFAARTEDGDVEFDEVVAFPLIPNSGVSGDFEPYEFEISTTFSKLIVEIQLEGERLERQKIPLGYVLSLPIGVSVFGVETVHHDEVEGLVAVRYECIRSF